MRYDYLKEGYLHIPRFFPSRLINHWADDLHWLVSQQLQLLNINPSQETNAVTRLSRSLIALNEANTEAQAQIYDEVNRRPWMYELASNNHITSWVKDLLDSEYIGIHPRLNIVMSMPGEKFHVAKWHQDRFYGAAHHIVCYIPLQHTGSFNGGLVIAPRKHLQGLLTHEKQNCDETKWFTIPQLVIGQFPEQRQLNLEAGDLVFFDGFLPHTANINTSKEVRFAITIRYSNLTDPFFIERGWQWRDLSEAGLTALACKEKLNG